MFIKILKKPAFQHPFKIVSSFFNHNFKTMSALGKQGVSVRNNDITIFVGYAPENAEQSEKLRHQLAFFQKRKRLYPIDFQFETVLMKIGDDYDTLSQTVKELLARSEIIILLISDNFVNSDFHYDEELLVAIEHHKQQNSYVVPVLLDFCLWEELPLDNIPILPDLLEQNAEKKRPVLSKNWQTEDEPFFVITKYISNLIRQIEMDNTLPPPTTETNNLNQPSSLSKEADFLPPPDLTASAGDVPDEIEEKTNEPSLDDSPKSIKVPFAITVPPIATMIKDDSADDFSTELLENEITTERSNSPAKNTLTSGGKKTPKTIKRKNKKSTKSINDPNLYSMDNPRKKKEKNSPLDAASCNYDAVYDYNQGIAIGVKDNQWAFWNSKGEQLPDSSYDAGVETMYDRARIKKNGKWGWINKNGEILVEPQYDDSSVFGENGLAKVKKDNLWGWINQNGKEIIPLQYENTYHFAGGLALVKANNLWGWINERGKIVIPLQYSTAYLFENSMALVEKDDKWGWINPKGKTVIPFDYDFAHDFREGLAVVCKDDRWGYINRKGKIVIPLEYDGAQWFEGGVAEVEKEGEYFFITAKNKRVDI